MAEFADLVAAALDTHDAAEAGARVHKVVQKELKRLDPTLDPVVTGYFNHSYIPDLVVQWKDAGKTVERAVYLRHSLRASRASGDFRQLAATDTASLFMSLAQEEPQEETARARIEVASDSNSRTLVTTVPAIDELAKPSASPDPVLGVVKASVIRSAKGVFAEDDAGKLVLPRDRRIQPEDFEAFTSVVMANFSEDAVVRINRVAGIVEQALADVPSPLEIPESGRLSSTEIRELVPYLLRLEGVTQDRDFWSSVAQLISFEEIERQWRGFSNLDLTPLAAAGADLWRATRALLSIRSEAIDDDDFDGTPKWSIAGGTLAAEVGHWRIAFAHASTKLKTSNRDHSPANWDDLQPVLANYRVTGVGLSGVVTQSTYAAVDDAADMKARIQTFIAGADDSFHVPTINVSTGVGGDAATIGADFTAMMLQANPHATLTTLTQVALDVLGYRYPTDGNDLDALFSGVQPEAPVDEDEQDNDDEQDDFDDDGGDDEDLTPDPHARE